MYDHIFQPINLAGTTIPNRIVRTAHSTAHGWVDATDDLILYHEARAKGGVGLSMLEIAGVHMSSPTQIPVYGDQVIAGFEKLVGRLHPHGMKVFQQLWHGGAAFPINLLGGAPWSASDVPNPEAGTVPLPMTQTMIDDLVAAFASAARRCKEGGIDGVEIHGAHGYLVGQFLSPLTNRREDDYGGSPENRTRFLREILTAIRAEVGSDYPVGVRFSASEEVDGGLEPDDVIKIAQQVEPLTDFIDVSLGSYYRFYKMLSTMDDPLGYELPKSGQVTRALQVPTIVTGRIMTLNHAEEIVAEGTADLVSMVRALIADPELVIKAREGRANEIRPCISSSQGCVGGIFGDTRRMGCVVNVAAGQEAMLPSDDPGKAPVPKKVMVIGGGAAGLEAARTAALRGHEVSLYELSRQLGGQVRIAALAPHRADYGAIVQWLGDEIERFGVKVHLGTFVDPDLVREVGADMVVIASGSTPRRDGFRISRPASPMPGADLPHVYTSWDLFGAGGRATVGSQAVVFDDTGGYEAISVAEELVHRGAAVTFVTRHSAIGHNVPAPGATILPAKERLYEGEFSVLTDAIPSAITTDAVEVQFLGSRGTTTVPADTVVMVGYNHPNRELADELGDYAGQVVVVGDANGSRTLQTAIHEGHMATRMA
ncbi:MAG: FAD-dependent oxidoreductase [Acidimicrobiales bacterium]|nr:FAD-dependent oxidoreductase [Acidimicrobiales bacterium]